MPKIISIHSYRGGTGKSNTVANLAVLLAFEGFRVGVVDTDIQSPGIHVLFGLAEKSLEYSLNDYLWGKCELSSATYDVTPSDFPISGKVYLIPSSVNPGEISQILRDGYDVGLLNDGFNKVITDLNLDFLLIDTHPGLNEETLLSIAISDQLIIVLRPDQQDYLGTGVTVEVARRLEVPEMFIVINKNPTVWNEVDVRSKVEESFNCDVAAVLPHSDDMMILASSGIFVNHHPNHPITLKLKEVAKRLVS